MAIQVPVYADPRDHAHPLTDVYVGIGELVLDVPNDVSKVVARVHPNAGAWPDAPVDLVTITGGDSWAAGHYFPRLTEFMNDPEFAAAFNVITAKLYAKMKLNPMFAGATDYTPPAPEA